MSTGICRDCGKEAVVSITLGLGPVCLKKYGVNQEEKNSKNATPIKVSNFDFSKVKNTFVAHGDADETPLDLSVHYALEKAGYDDFNKKDSLEIFDVVIRNFFNGDRVPAEFKDKLNEIGFEVKGFLPRMKCSPCNFINLIVGTKNSKLDMIIRINIDYNKGLMFFRTNPQYVLVSPNKDELHLSLRNEVSADGSEGPYDFNYFMTYSSSRPTQEYLDNFPQWVEENCRTNAPREKRNLYSTCNPTVSRRRGNVAMEAHKSELTLDELKLSSYLSPEQELVSPLRKNILKRTASKYEDLSDLDTLLRAVDEVEISTYEIYLTSLGKVFGHLSSSVSLKKIEADFEKPVPESASNNYLMRKIITAVDLCLAKGYKLEDSQKIAIKFYDKIYNNKF